MVNKLINGISIPLTDAEWTAISSQQPPVEFVEQEVRNQRNSLLSGTDYLALSDNAMTTEMAAYRQALRDITSQEGFPYSVTWPTKP